MHLPPTKSTRLLSRLEMLWLQLVTIVFDWVYNNSYVIWPSSHWKMILGWESPKMYSWCWRASLLGRGPKWRQLVPSQVSSVPPCAVLYTKPYKTWRRPWTGDVGKIWECKLAPLLRGGFQKKMVPPYFGKSHPIYQISWDFSNGLIHVETTNQQPMGWQLICRSVLQKH